LTARDRAKTRIPRKKSRKRKRQLLDRVLQKDVVAMVKKWKITEPEQSLSDAEASEFEKSSATFSSRFQKVKVAQCYFSCSSSFPPLFSLHNMLSAARFSGLRAARTPRAVSLKVSHWSRESSHLFLCATLSPRHPSLRTLADHQKLCTIYLGYLAATVQLGQGFRTCCRNGFGNHQLVCRSHGRKGTPSSREL